MWTRFLTAASLVLGLATSAAPQTNTLPPVPAPTALQLFRSVQRQVLTYPHFSVFDSINAQIKDSTGKIVYTDETLVGTVTLHSVQADRSVGSFSGNGPIHEGMTVQAK